MAIYVNVRVVSFGQIIFEIGKPAPPPEKSPIMPAHEEIRYRQPLETASRIYEVEYEQERRNYVTPYSTA